MTERNEPPENSPHDTAEEYLASQVLHSLRKPPEIRDEEDRGRIIELAERLSREVLDDE